jgi:hypothetical protein
VLGGTAGGFGGKQESVVHLLYTNARNDGSLNLKQKIRGRTAKVTWQLDDLNLNKYFMLQRSALKSTDYYFTKGLKLDRKPNNALKWLWISLT